MSRNNIKTIQEIISESTVTQDMSGIFEELWQAQRDMVKKIQNEMELNLKPDCKPYERVVSTDGNAVSTIYTYSGPKIDHLTNSNVFNKPLGFANIHLNIWISPELKVPGFGCVFGCLPALFHYNDFVPRYDIWHDVEHLDDYYMDTNDQYLDFMGQPGISPFISQDTYIRTAASPHAVGVALENNAENRAKVIKFANDRLDVWLGWMRDPKKVPAAEVEAMRRRDYRIRLANAHRDPANPVAFRMFGLEQGHRMLEQLWGVKWTDKLYDNEPETEGMTLKPNSKF